MRVQGSGSGVRGSGFGASDASATSKYTELSFQGLGFGVFFMLPVVLSGGHTHLQLSGFQCPIPSTT